MSGYNVFNNQASIDNFAVTHLECLEINGSVLIQGSDITNLDAFSKITIIDGDLTIRLCDMLTNFDGLDNLSSIGGELYYQYIIIRH